jgi:hypothetical protein
VWLIAGLIAGPGVSLRKPPGAAIGGALSSWSPWAGVSLRWITMGMWTLPQRRCAKATATRCRSSATVCVAVSPAFPLSFPEAEEIMMARGVIVSYEMTAPTMSIVSERMGKLVATRIIPAIRPAHPIRARCFGATSRSSSYR